jgi:ABC-type transporter Mla maintaining outer membrane lipid asymmetry ATPase subunit MlaF
VSRKPPKVNIEYSETIKKYADKIDIKQIELEIMKAIVESLLGNSGKRL